MADRSCPIKRMLQGMRKADVIHELHEYEVQFSEAWTLVELKELLKDARSRDPTLPRRDERMKGMAGKTINQLRSQCTEMGLEFTMKDTRGRLMLMIRARCETTPEMEPTGATKLTVGRYSGETYSQVLADDPGYADWVMQTIPDLRQEDPNGVHPSLISFEYWLSGRGGTPAKKEVVAPSVSTSDCGIPSKPLLPARPKAAPKRPGSSERTSMEAEMGKEGKAEIAALKGRIQQIEGHHQLKGEPDASQSSA